MPSGRLNGTVFPSAFNVRARPLMAKIFRRFIQSVVLPQPRSEEAVELLARDGRIQIDPIDLLRGEKTELHQEHRSGVRSRVTRALREEIFSILRKGDDCRVPIESED